MAISKSNKQKAKINKQLFLQGKPFLLPRRVDIHRYPLHAHLSEDESTVKDEKHTFVTNCGWSNNDSCTGNAKGRVWLILTKRWLEQKLTSKIAFHELDFDITVDQWGNAYKEINGEQVKQKYESNWK